MLWQFLVPSGVESHDNNVKGAARHVVVDAKKHNFKLNCASERCVSLELTDNKNKTVLKISQSSLETEKIYFETNEYIIPNSLIDASCSRLLLDVRVVFK